MNRLLTEPTLPETAAAVSFGSTIPFPITPDSVSRILEAAKDILMPIVPYQDKAIRHHVAFKKPLPKRMDVRCMLVFRHSNWCGLRTIALTRNGKWVVEHEDFVELLLLDSDGLAAHIHEHICRQEDLFSDKSANEEWHAVEGQLKQVGWIFSGARLLRFLEYFSAAVDSLLSEQEMRLRNIRSRANLLASLIKGIDPLARRPAGERPALPAFTLQHHNRENVSVDTSVYYTRPSLQPFLDSLGDSPGTTRRYAVDEGSRVPDSLESAGQMLTYLFTSMAKTRRRTEDFSKPRRPEGPYTESRWPLDPEEIGVLEDWAHSACMAPDFWEMPAGLRDETYVLQHAGNCPKPFMVRLIAPGSGSLDFLYPDTKDVLGYGLTPNEAGIEALEKKRELRATLSLRVKKA